jgi:uncharacterized protein
MRKLILLFAALTLTSTALAATPTKDSVETLLKVTRVERTLDGMLASIDSLMQQSMARAMAGKQQTAEQQRAMELMRGKVQQIFREEMTWAKLEPIYVQVYQDTFSQQEIDGLIKFYRTPTGVSYVDKLPIVMQKSMVATQAMMGPMMQKLQAAGQQAVEEAKAAQPAADKP